MPPFETFVTTKKLSYEGVVRILDCIDHTATKRNISVLHALAVIDTFYSGIKLAYESYQANGAIRIPSSDGVKIYNPDGTIEIDDTSKARINAQKTVKAIALNSTGARSGDIIIGVTDLSDGAIIRIIEGTVPPSKKDLDEVRLFPDMWEVLLRKLDVIDFFHEMSIFERSVWLSLNERAGDYDIAETDAIIEVMDVGKSNFLTIDSDQVTQILSGNEEREDKGWSALEVRNMFPLKPGSKARRPTLIFHPHRWKLNISYQRVSTIDGPVYDSNGKIVDGSSMEDEEFVVFENIPKSYLASKQGYKIDEKGPFGIVWSPEHKEVDYLGVLKSRIAPADRKKVDMVVEACYNFTAAGYKSLLQKIIRYAPLWVVVGDEEIDASLVLEAVFTLLLIDPGSFIPDIQRFVTGRESAVKRLLVTILEDSYSDDKTSLLKLAVLSFLAQRINVWRLTQEDYIWALEVCKSALAERRTFEHDIEKGMKLMPYSISSDASDLENLSALLDEVKSFATDLGMTRFIASNAGRSAKLEKVERPRVMNIEHCIDQHWAPEIVYFLPMKIAEQYREESSKPFSKLFRQIFDNVTGVNSRRKGRGLSGRDASSSDDFVLSVKEAQKLTMVAKQTSISPLKTTKGAYRILSKLDISWIAGLAGPINASGKPPAMVTMKPNDPYQLVAIRKPARGMKDGTLTDERIEDAIAKVEKELSTTGISLNKANPPVPEIGRCKLKKRGDEYIFVDGKNVKTWDQISNIDETIPFLEQTDVTLETALLYSGDGLQNRAFLDLENVIGLYSVKTIRRLLSYISSYRAEIEIARLSKDGGGTAQTPAIEDVGACQILLYSALLFPKALKRVQGYVSRFKIHYAPLFWEIKSKIAAHLAARLKENKEVKWAKVADSSKRKLRTYQLESIDEMKAKNASGKKGHFIWIPPGLGKTLISFTYLQHLISDGRMPANVIYSCPESAIKSIIKEIEYFGFQINLLIPIQGWKKHPFSNYAKDPHKVLERHINIIEHDHLRYMPEHLTTKASESIFIIDEVHKALNDTLRTSIALEISRLSIDFIAMTGTPIVDSNTYKLIWWLEQIVEFEVNDKNFWVAVNGMIAKKVNTGIFVDKQDVLTALTTSEADVYYSLVPLAMGGKNARPTHADITKAIDICYKACDREMVRQTLDFLKEKKGVMMVAKTEEHQNILKAALIKAGMKDKDIYLLKTSIFMTDEAVLDGSIPDYKVVIVPTRKSEGYTLTRMRAMVTCVYPSNNATREQLEGRINRVSQHSKEVHYRVVHTGILTYILQHHNDAASLSAVLSAIAKEIDMD